MRTLFTIAWYDLLLFLRSRGNLLQLVALPVILTLVLGFALGGQSGPQNVRLEVLDRDGSPRSQQLLADLRAQGPALQVCPAAVEDCAWDTAETPGLEVALERVRRGAADALLLIPPGFGESLETQQITLPFYTTASVPDTDPVWGSVQTALLRVNGVAVAGVTASELHRALELDSSRREAWVLAAQQLAADAWAGHNSLVNSTQAGTATAAPSIASGFTQTVPGMATFFALFSVMGGGIAALIRERREGALARLATLPLRRAELIGGKILARFAIGILQFLIVFAVGVATGLDFGRSPLALLLLMAAYTLAITALGLALGSRMQNEEQAMLLTSMLAMVMAALGGAWWPLSIAPQFMQTLGHLTPVAWAMDGFQQLIIHGGGLEDVLPQLTVLTGFSLVFFLPGLRNFRFR